MGVRYLANQLFLCKIALINLKKNRKTYGIYFIACYVTTFMFAMFQILRYNPGMNGIPQSRTLELLFMFAVWLVGIFSIIFLIYANSFLMKRRKKEFGLYGVLGLEKKHMVVINGYESFILAVSSIVLGIIATLTIGKISFLLLMKFITYVEGSSYQITSKAIVSTMVLFFLLHVLLFVSNAISIYKQPIISLLSEGGKGEKEPKAKAMFAFIGVCSLGYGYYLAITTKAVETSMVTFFVAGIFVIIGTYLLFIIGSIVCLKLLRKNKNFYYKPKNFISISNMIFRMKKNGAGLASICILSTMILITLSSTVCLYAGKNESLNNAMVSSIKLFENNIMVLDKEIMMKEVEDSVNEVGKQMGTPVTYYKDINKNTLFLYQNGNMIISESEDIEAVQNKNTYSSITINLITIDTYNRLENKEETLLKNDVLFYNYNQQYDSDSIFMAGKQFTIKKQLEQTTFTTEKNVYNPSIWLVVDSEQTKNEILGYYDMVSEKAFEEGLTQHIDQTGESYLFFINIDGTEQQIKDYASNLQNQLEEKGIGMHIENKVEMGERLNTMYGGLLFLGIFLGGLFTLGMILIIYFKQISESYEDRKRFQMLRKIGMEQKEMKRTINKQIRMVFYLPVIASLIHMAAAFTFMERLLQKFGLANTKLFFNCTLLVVVVFVMFYSVVYFLTGNIYHFDNVES